MHPKPVTRSDPPQYPTRSEILADGEVLRRHLPGAWTRGTRFLAAVSLLMATGASGCANRPAAFGAGSEPPKRREPVVSEASEWIRSIYDDGSGVGSTPMLGCVAIMPPSYLPEDEGMNTFTERLESVD